MLLIDLVENFHGGVLGGKVAGLAVAKDLGLKVPPAAAISIRPANDPAAWLSLHVESACESLKHWAKERGVHHVVVRSSAEVEDGATHSYAGIFESAFSPIESRAITLALEAVVKGCESPSRSAYEEAAGIVGAKIGFSVLIQATVCARASGVLFAAKGRLGTRMRVQSTWGLAKNLVEGVTTGDFIDVAEEEGPSDIVVGEKPLAIYPINPGHCTKPSEFSLVDFVQDGHPTSRLAKVVFVDEESALAYVRVPDVLSQSTSLHPALICELIRIGELTADVFSAGADVEWVEDAEGKVWIVQMRPITASPFPSEHVAGSDADSELGHESARPGATKLVGEPGASGTWIGPVADAASILAQGSEGDAVLICGAARPELMPAISRSSAIVSSDGGILCHVAIVARELGKPCVLGIRQVERELSLGEYVEVDGTRGIVSRQTSGARAGEVLDGSEASGQKSAGDGAVGFWVDASALQDHLRNGGGLAALFVTEEVAQLLKSKPRGSVLWSYRRQIALVFFGEMLKALRRDEGSSEIFFGIDGEETVAGEMVVMFGADFKQQHAGMVLSKLGVSE